MPQNNNRRNPGKHLSRRVWLPKDSQILNVLFRFVLLILVDEACALHPSCAEGKIQV